MGGARVVLVGGTSHVGKSTVARALAARLGFEHVPTDGLARHPGRPWRTPEREVPAHVADHYSSLTVDELIASVLGHYERLWPRVEELIRTSAADSTPGAGLVLEGSALWPALVARLEAPYTAAVWLTADEAVLRTRVHASGDHDRASECERLLMDTFLARTVRYQTLMVEAVDDLGLTRLDVGDGTPVADLVGALLAAVRAQASK
ncbi:AAA family ATPase [Streptomyces sp. AC555_RSS877]|uniref:AAA family ATPase n=1 Tax=Streptomyces sp. AC555_RSS877 TaxID=2823688 RepID=UPI001C2533F2|nr:AAA family ATPase [Streptomyces sp. AC555_RSS877]